MKNLIFILLFTLLPFSKGFSQFFTNAEKLEAEEMIAICNSFTFLDLYNSDSTIIPTKYQLTYTSPILGLDNKFQVYKTNSSAVINLRGSTAKKISWLENFYSSMIPTEDTIVIQDKKSHYKLSNDTNATVHAGFTLGLVFIADDVVKQINKLNEQNIYNITITGHSQGGALAILLRAYLELLPSNVISQKNNFKTYAFAHPKVGNRAFVDCYSSLCEKGSNYSIVNPEDIVPRTPLSYTYTNTNSIKKIMKIYNDQSVSLKEITYGKIGYFGRYRAALTVNYLSKSIHKEICKTLGDITIEMPKYKSEINYCIMPNRIELDPFEYPEIHKKKENGKDREELKKEPNFFQHKSYNYYVGFLKMFYQKRYNKLKVKVLPENL